MRPIYTLWLAFFSFPAWAVNTHEQPPKDVQTLIAKFEKQNDICRGTSPNTPEKEAKMNAGCSARDLVYSQIGAKGWCYGNPKSAPLDPASDSFWMRCPLMATVKDVEAAEKEDARKSKSQYCQMKAELIQHTAAVRNSGRSPEQALVDSNSMGTKQLPLSERKDTINLVYFDSRFAPLTGNISEFGAFYDACMRDWKPKFQPLK